VTKLRQEAAHYWSAVAQRTNPVKAVRYNLMPVRDGIDKPCFSPIDVSAGGALVLASEASTPTLRIEGVRPMRAGLEMLSPITTRDEDRTTTPSHWLKSPERGSSRGSTPIGTEGQSRKIQHTTRLLDTVRALT
jgi:hypothetical protein